MVVVAIFITKRKKKNMSFRTLPSKWLFRLLPKSGYKVLYLPLGWISSSSQIIKQMLSYFRIITQKIESIWVLSFLYLGRTRITSYNVCYTKLLRESINRIRDQLWYQDSDPNEIMFQFLFSYNIDSIIYY